MGTSTRGGSGSPVAWCVPPGGHGCGLARQRLARSVGLYAQSAEVAKPQTGRHQAPHDQGSKGALVGARRSRVPHPRVGSLLSANMTLVIYPLTAPERG